MHNQRQLDKRSMCRYTFVCVRILNHMLFGMHIRSPSLKKHFLLAQAPPSLLFPRNEITRCSHCL